MSRSELSIPMAGERIHPILPCAVLALRPTKSKKAEIAAELSHAREIVRALD